MVDARREGRGQRLFYDTRGAADTKSRTTARADKLHGRAATLIPERLRIEAIECGELLAPVGATLREAVIYFLAHAKLVGAPRTVFSIIAQFLDVKRRRTASRAT